MEKPYLIMIVIVLNTVILGVAVALKSRKLRASGSSPAVQLTGTQRLMTGAMAFIGLVVFVVLISLYFVQSGGGAGG